MPIDPSILEQIRTNDPTMIGFKLTTNMQQWTNEIDEDAAKALAAAFSSNHTLKKLQLGHGRIGPAGARVFAESLKQNATLNEFDLSMNKIGDDGAMAIAEALKDNDALTVLNLSTNEIGALGVAALAEALTINATLTFLSIVGNEIDSFGVAALVKALKINTTLKHLVINKKQIDESTRSLIESYLARNQKVAASKVAWAHPIVGYSDENRHIYLAEIKEKLGNAVGEQFDVVIMAILDFRNYSLKFASLPADVVLDGLNKFLVLAEIDFEGLAETDYLKELHRLLTGKIDALNVNDAEAQANALICLVHPFVDKGLQTQAIPELIGLLNNDHFGKLKIGSTQRCVIDILILTLSCQFPVERDLMRFALAASARLAKSENPTLLEINAKLENKEAVIAEFKKTLSKVSGIAEYSPDVLMEKCLEEINEAFIQQTPLAPSPNIYALFQPAAAPVEQKEKPAHKSRGGKR